MLKDILAFIAPTCVIFAGFAYYRTMQMKRALDEMEKKFSTLVQDNAISFTNLKDEIAQIREGFIKTRRCPACNMDKQASDFAEQDYICKTCREETYTDAEGTEWQINP